MGRIIYRSKNITKIHSKQLIENVFRGSLKVFKYLREITSCFGMGYWINESPWKNDEGWKNNK